MDIHPPKPWLVLTIRYFLGSVFVVAGFSKLFPLNAFIKQALAYNVPVPDELLYYLSIFIIAAEIWVGLSILLNSNLRISLLGAQILLIGMIPITIWGSLNQAPTCGCYGNLVQREPWQATVEDCLLLTVSFLLVPTTKNGNKQLTLNTAKAISIMLITIGALVYGIMQINQVLSFQPEKLL